jgi:hypothetical protein
VEPKPKNQHYVPQFLLRNFGCGRGKQIFVFDKASGEIYQKPIKKVTSGRGFYDCEVDGAPHSVDPLLTEMENVSSRIISRIVTAHSLRVLSDTGRKMVALFATVQMLRTDARRKELKDMIDDVYAAVKSMGHDPNKVEGFEFLNEEDTRAASITSLRTLTVDLMPYFLNKSWILYSTTQEHPFCISDNPVTRFNTNKHPFLSMLGLRALGIEIYLPLSSVLCLGFLCPTVETTIRESDDLASRLGHPVPPGVHEWITALDIGAAVALAPSNVTHHNSLQVASAERFVFSSSDDFSLAREMLRQLPELKGGPRNT